MKLIPPSRLRQFLREMVANDEDCKQLVSEILTETNGKEIILSNETKELMENEVTKFLKFRIMQSLNVMKWKRQNTLTKTTYEDAKSIKTK